MSIYRRPDPIPRIRPALDVEKPLAPLREQGDLNQLAAKRIFMEIVAGRWGARGYLPKEDDLGEELGVSRTVVREATKYLASKSVVETRRRRGTAILEPDLWNLVDREIIEWMSESRLFPKLGEQLIDALAMTQPFLAAKAAGARPADKTLARIAERIGHADDRDRTDAAMEFHLGIAQVAGNPFLQSLTIKVIEGLSAHCSEVLEGYVKRLEPKDYASAANAISSGDPDAAHEAVSRLFSADRVEAL